MIGNNNLYKTIWKNGNEEYNEKHIYCFFTIWNLISAITCKCGRVVLFLTSVYFAISKAILIFSCSFHAPCIILPNNFFFTLYDPCFPYFLIDHNQKQVLLIKRVIIFLYLKNIFFFRSFQLFENHFRKVASKLINVMKLEVENINMLI